MLNISNTGTFTTLATTTTTVSLMSLGRAYMFQSMLVDNYEICVYKLVEILNLDESSSSVGLFSRVHEQATAANAITNYNAAAALILSIIFLAGGWCSVLGNP